MSQSPRMYALFSELPVTAEFTLNGNRYRKRSRRTAEFAGDTRRAFGPRRWYFAMRELVVVGAYSRLAAA